MKLLDIFKRPPDFKVGGDENPYMLRWFIIPRNPILNIYLHKFLRDDDDRALHDHPWPSLSIILKGGYIEHLPHGMHDDCIDYQKTHKYQRRVGQFIFRKAEQAHRIELHPVLLPDCPTATEVEEWSAGKRKRINAWSLFITGRKVREWGFYCKSGWRHWKIFCDERDHGKVGKGCAE